MQLPTGKGIFLLLLFLLSFTGGQAQKEAMPVYLFRDKVSIMMPAIFTPDSRVILPPYNFVSGKPAYAFSSSNKASCLVYYSADSLSDNDVPAFADLLISKIKGLYPSVSINDDGISLNDGKNVGYIKCAVGKGRVKKFLQLFYGSFNGKVLLFLVDFEAKTDRKWSKVIDIMISSLRINDNQ